MVEVNELHRAIRQLLADMATVSEAATTQLQSSPGHAKPGWKPPKGPKVEGLGEGHKSTPDGSHIRAGLFDEWTNRFASETDPNRLAVLLRLGQAALGQRRHKIPARQRDEAGAIDVLEDEERILDWYTGYTPEEAAEMESMLGSPCAPAYIRKVRARNDRDAQRGNERPPSDRRLAMAREMRAQGLSERKIAIELNVSRTTVRRLLDSRTVDRRAA